MKGCFFWFGWRKLSVAVSGSLFRSEFVVDYVAVVVCVLILWCFWFRWRKLPVTASGSLGRSGFRDLRRVCVFCCYFRFRWRKLPFSGPIREFGPLGIRDESWPSFVHVCTCFGDASGSVAGSCWAPRPGVSAAWASNNEDLDKYLFLVNMTIC